jgi:hypothetical protein
MSQSVIPDETEDMEIALVAVAYDMVKQVAAINGFSALEQYAEAFRYAYDNLLDTVYDVIEEREEEDDEDEEVEEAESAGEIEAENGTE